MDQIREDLLNGIQSPQCYKCWENEDNGLTSRRGMHNKLLTQYGDKSLAEYKQLALDGHIEPLMYQLTISNLCNATCVTCGPGNSTKWSRLVHDGLRFELETIPIIYETAKYVLLVGGEPLLEPVSFEIIDNLIAAGNTTCRLSMSTNGSIRLTDKQLESFRKLINTDICVSIDGIGKVFEYMRYPLKWDDVSENLFRLRDAGLKPSISYTVSNINKPYHEETIAWFKEHGFPYFINPVHAPAWFNGPITERTIEELDKQDKLKGIDRNDYLPYLIIKSE